MNRAKVEKHGYFFRNGRLRTECRCGCVYLTRKKKVHIRTDYYTHKETFQTQCPECLHVNDQVIEDLRASEEEKNGKEKTQQQ